MYNAIANGKRKPSRFPFIRLPFAHRANGSLSFVRLSMKKQREVIRLQTDLADLPNYGYNIDFSKKQSDSFFHKLIRKKIFRKAFVL
jgi:hypothetical protein